MSAHWWAFVVAAAALIMIPGPDVLLVLRNAITGGRRGGLATGLGTSTGTLVHASAAAAGLSALLTASATAFTVVKVVGAVYLGWLGLAALRSAWRGGTAGPGGMDGPGDTAATMAPARGFRQGLVTNVVNPKVAVFFLTLLPQFVDPAQPALPQTLLLGATFWVLTLLWLGGLAIAAGRMRRVLARRLVRRGIEAFAGALFVGFGVRLAVGP